MDLLRSAAGACDFEHSNHRPKGGFPAPSIHLNLNEIVYEKFSSPQLIVNSIAFMMKEQDKGSTNNDNIFYNVLSFYGQLKRKGTKGNFGQYGHWHNGTKHVKEQ
tara:strand:- start:16098 stop:16412 length:315 start_codon:yes stop_codon:yes gene_type:complete